MSISAPEPIIEDGWIQCPMVDVARIEALAPDEARQLSLPDMLCEWRKSDSSEVLSEYERHFRQDHWEPFTAFMLSSDEERR